MSLKKTISGILGVVYPVLEGTVNEEVEEAGRVGADFVAARVAATDNPWDHEGAEKLELLLLSAGTRLRERRLAGAPAPDA